MKTSVSPFSLAILIVLFLITVPARSQTNTTLKTVNSYSYVNAIGFRFGGTSGVTYKHRFQERHAAEWIIGTSPYAFGFTGLYEYYFPTTVEGLNLYAGGGGHISWAYHKGMKYYYVTDNDRVYYYSNYGRGPIVGIDAIGGIEYKVPKAPIAVSLDLKPYVEFYRDYSAFGLDPGLGVKFAF